MFFHEEFKLKKYSYNFFFYIPTEDLTDSNFRLRFDYHKNGDKYKQNLKKIYDELTYAKGVSKKELRGLNDFLIEISRYEHIFNKNEKDAIDKLLDIVVEIMGKFDMVSEEDYKKIIKQLNTILKIIGKKEFEL